MRYAQAQAGGGFPWGSSVKRWACFWNKLGFPLAFLSRRRSWQRLGRVALGSRERLQWRILSKCKRGFCPKSWCINWERRVVRLFRWLFSTVSLGAGWLGPQLHDVLEQLERPHDVVILRRGEGREGGKNYLKSLPKELSVW